MQFNKMECNLLAKVGDYVEENIDYSKKDIQGFSADIATHIMSNSSKNGDIAKSSEEFNDLLVRFARALA